MSKNLQSQNSAHAGSAKDFRIRKASSKRPRHPLASQQPSGYLAKESEDVIQIMQDCKGSAEAAKGQRILRSRGGLRKS